MTMALQHIEMHSLASKLESLENLLRAANNSASLTQVNELLRQLEAIVGCEDCHESYDSYDKDNEIEKRIDRVQEQACRSFGLLEKDLGQRKPQAESVARYLSTVSHTARREAQTLGLDHRSKLLFIGCGARPISCHALSTHFGCQVVGVDVDPECIEQAREYAKIVAQESRLSFLQANGREVDATGYSHVFVASLVENKEQVLKNLLAQSDEKVRVAVRFGEGLQRLMNYPLSPLATLDWKLFAHHCDPQALYQTVFLQKS